MKACRGRGTETLMTRNKRAHPVASTAPSSLRPACPSEEPDQSEINTYKGRCVCQRWTILMIIVQKAQLICWRNLIICLLLNIISVVSQWLPHETSFSVASPFQLKFCIRVCLKPSSVEVKLSFIERDVICLHWDMRRTVVHEKNPYLHVLKENKSCPNRNLDLFWSLLLQG